VYVTPGNHDINNVRAQRYLERRTESVPYVTPAEFAQIYGSFGYDSAILRDRNTLSYVAEPVEGLWLLSLDPCRYRENRAQNRPVVGGRFNQRTINWITDVLREANENNKAVIAFIHHLIVEQYTGHAKRGANSLVNDFHYFGKLLASWNVRVVFTGHGHAQNITRADFDRKYIYDIQTGSLVTPPCPIRYIEIKDNVMSIRSETFVDKIYPDTDFLERANELQRASYIGSAKRRITWRGASKQDVQIIAEAMADATIAFVWGDEDETKRVHIDRSTLGLIGRSVLKRELPIIDALWADLPPADNNLRILLD
jgi:hypothetical protein